MPPAKLKGRPPLLQNQINDFVKDMVKLKNNEKKLKARWQVEIDKFCDKTIPSQLKYCSDFRAAFLKKVDSDFKYKKALKTPKAILDAVKIKYKKPPRNTHNMIPINNWNDIITMANSYLKSDDPYKLTIGILLSTGRSIADINQYCEFKKSRNLKFNLYFRTTNPFTKKHIVKKNWFKIPVLAKSKIILKAHKKLRKNKIKIKTKELDDIIFNSFKTFFPNKKKLQSKDLICFYAELNFCKHCPDYLSKSAYFSVLFGYSKSNYKKSLEYMKYYIEDDQFKAINEKGFKSLITTNKKVSTSN